MTKTKIHINWMVKSHCVLMWYLVKHSHMERGGLKISKNMETSYVDGPLQWCSKENQNDPIYVVNDLFVTWCFTILRCYHALVLLAPLYHWLELWNEVQYELLPQLEQEVWKVKVEHFKILTLTYHNFCTSWGTSSYSTSF